MEEENKEEMEKISKLKVIIGISIAILISILLICGYLEKFFKELSKEVEFLVSLCFGILFCIFLILNNLRFIKYRKWYVDPWKGMIYPLCPWREPDERTKTDIVWLWTPSGIFLLAVFVQVFVGAIFGI
jgi:hypothetical protein